MELTTIKTLTVFAYSLSSAILLSIENNHYDTAFQDPYLYISGFLGMGLMLFVEKVDDKSITKPTFKKVIFSILACLTVMFFSGIARADFLGEWKPFWIYLPTMFFCTIAPEVIQRLINTSPKHIERGVNRGIEKKIEKMIAGDNDYIEDEQDHYE